MANINFLKFDKKVVTKTKDDAGKEREQHTSIFKHITQFHENSVSFKTPEQFETYVTTRGITHIALF